MSYTVAKNGTPAQQTSYSVQPGRAVHMVKPGESLAAIARLHGTTTSNLITLNQHTLGSNGHNLEPGMRLEL